MNSTSNAFGNGVFDNDSIVVGDEYSEAVTGPDNFFSIQDGWNDASTSENADKCAWYHTRQGRLRRLASGSSKWGRQPVPAPPHRSRRRAGSRRLSERDRAQDAGA